jgi:hypothetical protein
MPNDITDAMVEDWSAEPERVFLQPKSQGDRQDEGRMWCEDEAFDREDGDVVPEYIRLDLHRAALEAAEAARVARPGEEYHEDMGDMLWWRFPIDEPPYAGSPLDTDWPGYHTHFTPILIPTPPEGE